MMNIQALTSNTVAPRETPRVAARERGIMGDLFASELHSRVEPEGQPRQQEDRFDDSRESGERQSPTSHGERRQMELSLEEMASQLQMRMSGHAVDLKA